MSAPNFRTDRYAFGCLQVILKTVERCNLACDYCYYFFGGDESYKERQPVIGISEINQIHDFLRQGCIDLNIPELHIVFHGGEPMLQKPRHFDEMCKTLKSISDVTRVKLGMQTNGTIMSPEWMKVIQKHEIEVGVSIDGSKELHDKHRKTVLGKGSYDLIVGNLASFKQSNAEGLGSISVLGADLDYALVFQELGTNLGISQLSFLLPDCSHDNGIPGGYTAEHYGKQLCDIFDASMETGTPVREVGKVLDHFQEKVLSNHASKRITNLTTDGKKYQPNQIVVIHSDGKLDIDDSYIPAQNWRQGYESPHVSQTTLRSYLNSPQFDVIDDANETLPTQCSDCEWRNICRGGDLENRWSTEAGFNNPSVYCEGLKLYYAHVVRYLYSNGYPKDKIIERLGL